MRDSRTLTTILDDLLIAADPRNNIVREAVDLVATADAVIASMRAHAHAHNLALERSGTAERAVIHGAGAAITRLYTALISNALDFAESMVTVRVDVDGRSAVVSVLDDGPGFSRDLVAHAFEPFVTGRPTTGDPASADHSGLGLAIVAEITRRHHGRVRIEQNGHGAIVLHLPLSSS
jgi:signal transduction histidine kinase